MKTLYYINDEWKSVKDKEFTDLYLHKSLFYGEMPETVETTFRNFQFAVDTFEKLNARPEVRYTLFRKKPYLYFNVCGGMYHEAMTARRFRPFVFRVHTWQANGLTMKEIMEELPAENFIEYCKDHGLSVKLGD